MASTAEELIVSLKAEGAEKVNQSVNKVDEGMAEMSESVSDTSDELQGFSQRFQGAMAAAVAAVAVGVAGLAQQVPVVGGLLEGFGAIIDAMLMQLDQLLRDLGVEGLTGELFNVADGLFAAEGATGDLIGAFAGISVVVGSAIAGFLSYTAAMGGFPAVVATVKGALATLTGSIGGVVSGTIAAAAALGALIGLLTVGLLEVFGINDAFREMGKVVGGEIPAVFRDLTIVVLGAMATLGAAILGFVKGTLDGGLMEGFSRAGEMAKEAFGVVMDAFDRLVDGFMSDLQMLLDMTEQVMSDIESTLGIDLNVEGSRASDNSNLRTGRTGNSGGGSINVDGRDLTEDTGRFRQDALSRRGL